MLEINQLSVEYRSRKSPPHLALDEVTLSVAPGEFVVALGASGCGKTTLLNTIAGFVAPSRGEVRLDGQPIDGPGHERGVVFQKHALMPWMNVIENVEFGLRLRKMPLDERRRIGMECLRRVGLSQVAHRPVYELSGGMQQRVGVARAIASSPQVMLLDEPLGALDAMTRERMQELLLTIWQASGAGVLLITHSVEEALFLGTRVVVLAPGKGLVSDAAFPYSRRFLAGEKARALKAEPGFIAAREQLIEAIHDNEERDAA